MSNGTALAILLIALVAIAGGVLIIASPHGDDKNGGSEVQITGEAYDITYVLNGGSLKDAAATYTSGKYTGLPYPENGDKYFEGWFSDESCTIPVGAILPSTTGDLTLYASWADNLVGTGFEMDIDGLADSFLFKKKYSGTMTWMYSAYNNGAYYIQRDTDIKVGSQFSFFDMFSNNIRETDYYWTDEPNDVEYVYKGNSSVSGNFFGSNGTYLCEIWEAEGDKQYIYRGNYPLKIESSEGGINLTYTFSKEITFDPVTEFEPTIYADHGITVSGSWTAKIGESYTLTASGADFSGWYIDGQLATSSVTLTDTRATPEKTYEARSSQDYLTYEERDLYFEDYGLRSPVTVLFEDGSTQEFEKGIRFNSGTTGYFTLVDSQEPVHCVLRVYKEKTSTFSVTWEYGNKRYSMTFDMKYSDVYKYTNNGKARDKFQTYSDVSPYFTVDDPYVKLACSKLLESKGAMTDREFASFVMRFVQTIPYEYDEVSRGAREYWKYPAETFWDGEGDCEDSSILYVTLMKAMGYDTALIVYVDHAMASIHFANNSDNYGDQVVTINGKRYVLVETTGTGISWTDRDGYQLGDVFDSDYAVSKIRKTFVAGASA
ncbi:MAG: InlB B-repeat-containing protein [Candidatus Methanomethylophilaceae archaeon]|nr:InlB B-repeat-containing protein [Candidatus Methanomethylophilaceae archaeon]